MLRNCQLDFVLLPAREPNENNCETIFGKDDEGQGTGSRGAVPGQKRKSLFEAKNKEANGTPPCPGVPWGLALETWDPCK